MCDGYFFPLSHRGSEGSFSRDQAKCSEACPGARIYYYRPGSQDAEDMVDVSGQPYSRLKTANLFRTQYVESCKCKPHPWEQASVDRHRIYALEDQRRKGNRAVVAELEQLKSKSRVEAREARRHTADVRRGRHALRQIETATQVLPVTVSPSQAPRSDATRGQSPEHNAPATAAVASAPAAMASAISAATPAAQSKLGAPALSQTAAVQRAPVQTAALPAAASIAGTVVDAPQTEPAPAEQPLPQLQPAPLAAGPADIGGPGVEDLPVAPKADTRRKSRRTAQRAPNERPAAPRTGGSSAWVAQVFGR